MGSTNFSDSGWIERKTGNIYSYSDIRPLFYKLQEEAERSYGQEYTGEINMKDGFRQCGVMTRKQFNNAQKWWDSLESGRKRVVPKLIKDQRVEQPWHDALDKWESACAVVIKDETRESRILSGTFIEDKGVIPAPRREKQRYKIVYDEGSGYREKRVQSVPEAWRFIKESLKKNPEFRAKKIENAYTYAKPIFKERHKKARMVRVEFFGFANT